MIKVANIVPTSTLLKTKLMFLNDLNINLISYSLQKSGRTEKLDWCSVQF